MISNLSHVAIRVPDLDVAVRHATGILGLIEVERTSSTAYLTQPSLLSHPTPHHTVQYIEGSQAALDHVGLEVAGEAALEQLQARVEAEGVAVAQAPEEPGMARAVRFEGPDGHVFDVCAGVEQDVRSSPPHAVQPRRLGHVMLKVGESLDRSLDFLTRVLGFSISDYVGTPEPSAAFVRCNALHHTIALACGSPGLNHYAFELASVNELARLGDVLDHAGGRLIWGPGRHGAGDNLATYHVDPAGVLVEHYADMQLILADDWAPRRWALDDYRNSNTWGPMADVNLIERGVGLAAPAALR